MSLDDCLDPVEQKLAISRKITARISHYSRFTLESIIQAPIHIFRIPICLDLDTKRYERNLNFLEEVINHSVGWTVGAIALGTAIVYLPFGAALVASNVLFSGYQYIRNKIKKKADIKDMVETKESIDAADNSKEYLGELLNRLKKFAKGLPRKLGVFTCTYALIASLAVGHYSLTYNTKHSYNKNRVNIDIRKFTLECGNEMYNFYILGEVHLYNYSSSFHAKKFIEKVKPDTNLTEGMGPEEFEKAQGWRKYSEYSVVCMYIIYAKGSGMYNSSPYTICKEQGIPIIHLEKIDEEKKGREGVSDSSYVLLGAAGTVSLLSAPVFYFAIVPQRYFGMTNLEKLALMIAPGQLHKRNELMAESAISKMEKRPELIYLITIGKAHMPGMVDELSKYGKLHEVPFSFNPLK